MGCCTTADGYVRVGLYTTIIGKLHSLVALSAMIDGLPTLALLI
jgi:hypothetical protein